MLKKIGSTLVLIEVCPAPKVHTAPPRRHPPKESPTDSLGDSFGGCLRGGLDLTIADDIPDSRTIWLFSERLTNLDLVKELFELFESSLEGLGLVAHEGKLVDACFVEVPRQRNSRQENASV